MCDPVQQGCGHLCVSKDGDPFAELKVGCDDDAGLLIELTDEVKQQLAAGLREGLVAAGAVAVDVDMVPTPALYLAVSVLEADGGIQVTGSHNPPEFNGFKLVLDGESLYGEDIQALYRLIADGRLAFFTTGANSLSG